MTNLSSGTPAQITPFSFGTHAVRVIQRDGEPWFVAKDVCDALDYVNSRDAIADHLDDDERSTVANSDSRNNGGKLTIINESGLYALILRSRKPQARKFAKWVTSEVLPSIRKTGSYGNPDQSATDRLKKAQAAAQEFAAKASQVVFDAWLKDDRAASSRWLFALNRGHNGQPDRMWVTPIEHEAMIAPVKDLPKMIADADLMIGADLLAEISQVCIKRLAAKVQGMKSIVDSLRQTGMKEI